ncbi:MAG TPA: hypothetical protein VMH85_20365, partial [Terriglobales bacterium]|nr:hypothetical protein [Terriglobales bacterium]
MYFTQKPEYNSAMRKHRNWIGLWWAILQHFGKECQATWSGEVTAAAIGGLAAAATGFFRSRGHLSFTDAAEDGLLGALFVFAIYAIGQLFRSPWLEHSDKHAVTRRDGIIGLFLATLLLGASGLMYWLIAGDLRSQITLIAPADPGQVKAIEECRGTLAALTKPEAKDSLRRRTIQLVNDLGLFWSRIPMPPQQSVQNPANDEERKRNEAWAEYWRRTTVAYTSKDFNQRILGIVREYKAKGVPVGFLEVSAEQPDRLIGAAPYGGFSLEHCEAYQ